MLFKISNIGMQSQLMEYIDSIRTDSNLDVITVDEKDDWASWASGRDITSENTYVALFGAGDIMIVQDLIGYPIVIDRGDYGRKPRIRIMDRM